MEKENEGTCAWKGGMLDWLELMKKEEKSEDEVKQKSSVSWVKCQWRLERQQEEDKIIQCLHLYLCLYLNSSLSLNLCLCDAGKESEIEMVEQDTLNGNLTNEEN